MNTQVIRIGTRGSRLALTQTEWVAARLREAHPGLETRIVTIQTTGDRLPASPLSEVGGKGVFTREIEQALALGEIDLAVHSLKDMPAEDPGGLRLVAFPEREDPADVLAGAQTLDWRAAGSTFRIATSSLRRQAQLLRTNPSLRVERIRGNVTTRLRRALDGDFDAVCLAAAGLLRLEIAAAWMERLSFEEMLPAPCQGALGLQARADDSRIAKLVQPLNDAGTEAACRAERAFLRRLGGGCRAPIAALATIRGETMALDGLASSPDGKSGYRQTIEGPAENAEAIGRELAEALLARGAGELISALMEKGGGDSIPVDPAANPAPGPLSGRKIIVTRDEDSDGPLCAALRALGGEPLSHPVVEERLPESEKELTLAAAEIGRFDWIVFSSRRGVMALARVLKSQGQTLGNVRAKIACAGRKTAEAARSEGAVATVISEEGGAEALLDLLRGIGDTLRGARALHPASEEALPTLAAGLRDLGLEVTEAPAYGMKATGRGPNVAARLREGECDAIVFASASAAMAMAGAWRKGEAQVMRAAFASIGPTTSAAMRKAGMWVDVEAHDRTFEGLAAALGEWFSGENRK